MTLTVTERVSVSIDSEGRETRLSRMMTMMKRLTRQVCREEEEEPSCVHERQTPTHTATSI